MSDGARAGIDHEEIESARKGHAVGGSGASAQRAYGRSKKDFDPLRPGEGKLLEACRLGNECRLSSSASLVASFNSIVAMSGFFEQAVAPALKAKVPETGVPPAARTTLEQQFVSAFSAFAESFYNPVHPCDRETASEELRNLYQIYKDKFGPEVSGWRAVELENEDIEVRGSFIRFLALGGDDAHPVHELGIRLFGAHVVPDSSDQTIAIDLSGCRVTVPVRLEGCYVAGSVSMSGGHTRSFNLDGTRVSSIDGSSTEISGDLKLGKGFVADCGILLQGARIAGSVNCESGSLQWLDADAADIGGNLLIGENFVSYGRLRLGGTRVAGKVAMHGGFYRIAETMNDDRVHARPRMKFALDFRNLRARELFLGPDLPTSSRTATLLGSINLVAARVQSFVFEPTSLPPASIETPDGKRECTVTLDGFRYEHLGVTAGTDLLDAMKVLFERQPSSHLDDAFRPQPYEQLTKCLVEMGQEKNAKTVAQWKAGRVRRQERLRLWPDFVRRIRGASGSLRAWPPTWTVVRGVLAWPFKVAGACIALIFETAAVAAKWLWFNLFLGAGHRHGPAYAAFFALLLGCGFIYDQASRTPGAFVPVDKDFTLNARQEKRQAPCGIASRDGPVHWTKCAADLLPELHEFRPYVYSLDLMLQFGPLGQKRAWEPATESETRIPIEIPFHGQTFIQPRTLNNLTIAQSLLAIFLYLLIAKMLTTQIREK